MLTEMDTKKFLQTDLKTYLDQDKHVTCIHASQKTKDKIIQYKYNRNMKSSYANNFDKNNNGNH